MSRRPDGQVPLQCAALLSILFLAAATHALAQDPTSIISGTVRTAEGEPVRDVRIEFTQSGRVRSLTTDSTGKFAFYFAAAGHCTFRFGHTSILEIGRYEATIKPCSFLDLMVILNRYVPGVSC